MPGTETDYSLAFYGIESGVERMRSFHETVTAGLRGIVLSPSQVLIGRPGLGGHLGYSCLRDVGSRLSRFHGGRQCGDHRSRSTGGYHNSVRCERADVRMDVTRLWRCAGRSQTTRTDGWCLLAQGLIETLSPSLWLWSSHGLVSRSPVVCAVLDYPDCFRRFSRLKMRRTTSPKTTPRICGTSPRLIEDPDKSLEQIVQWGKMAMPMELYRKGILRVLLPLEFSE